MHLNGLRLYVIVVATCIIFLGQSITERPAGAQSAPFFQGQTIRIIVGFTAGGLYDQYARILARHMPKHIPGQPNIIVQNMPGAGSLTALDTQSTLPKSFTGQNTTAEVRVHPSGKFVYGSNRGHDSIAVFAVDAVTGKLQPRGHTATQGKTPRNFNIDPSGQYLIAANQVSNTLVAFRVDPASGALAPTGSAVSVPSPVCVVFTSRP